MSDIVEELKNAQLAVFGQGNFGEDDLGFFETDLGKRAAAEIERLQAMIDNHSFDHGQAVAIERERSDAEIAQLRQRIAELEDPHYLKGLQAEIATLRAELATMREGLPISGNLHEALAAERERWAKIVASYGPAASPELKGWIYGIAAAIRRSEP